MGNSLHIKVDYKLLTDLIYVFGGFYLFSFMQKLDYLIFHRNPEPGLYFWASLGVVLLSLHLSIYYFGRLVIYSKHGINFFKYKKRGSVKGLLFLILTVLIIGQLLYFKEINVYILIIELYGVILFANEVYQIYMARKYN